MYLRRLFNPIFPPLKEGEKRIIHSMIQSLPPQVAERVRRQVDKINFVQRNYEGNEICSYYIKWCRPFWDPNEKVSTLNVETKLGRVEFRSRDSSKVESVELWLVNGHFFSMQLSCSPKNIANQNAFDILRVEVSFGEFP